MTFERVTVKTGPGDEIVIEEKQSFIKVRAISFGGTLGLCTGFLFKKVGKALAVTVGLIFVTLQVSAYCITLVELAHLSLATHNDPTRTDPSESGNNRN